jgi:hypothetical protein
MRASIEFVTKPSAVDKRERIGLRHEQLVLSSLAPFRKTEG